MNENQIEKVKKALKGMSQKILDRKGEGKGFPVSAAFWEEESKIIIATNVITSDDIKPNNLPNNPLNCELETVGGKKTRHDCHAETLLKKQIKKEFNKGLVYGVISLPPCCWCLTELNNIKNNSYDLLIITDALAGKMKDKYITETNDQITLMKESWEHWNLIKKDMEAISSYYFLKLKALMGAKMRLKERGKTEEEELQRKRQRYEVEKEIANVSKKYNKIENNCKSELCKNVSKEWKMEMKYNN